MSGPVIVLGGGIALLGYLVYDYMQYRMRLRLRGQSTEKGIFKRVSYDSKVYAMIAFTVVLALLFARGIDRPVGGEEIEGVATTYTTERCLVVSIYIIVVGLWWAFYQARKARVSERMMISIQVNELVNSFRSVFRIRPTVFSALEEANRKLPPPVGSAVAHAVTTFYVTSLPSRSFSELRQRIDNPYMEQFIYILERGEDAKHQDILAALSGLQERLRRARDIRDKSEVNMTVITGQTRIIQMIAVFLVTVVAVIPDLRMAYESLPGQLLFMIIASVGVGTSWYIDRRSTALKERVL